MYAHIFQLSFSFMSVNILTGIAAKTDSQGRATPIYQSAFVG